VKGVSHIQQAFPQTVAAHIQEMVAVTAAPIALNPSREVQVLAAIQAMAALA
jgi:hypothetical protein